MSVPLSRTYGENEYNRKSSGNNPKSRNHLRKKSKIKPNSQGNRNNSAPPLQPTPPPPPSQDKTPLTLSRILTYLFRAGICGVGIGTIFGTVLVNLDLTKPLFPSISVPFIEGESSESQTPPPSKGEDSDNNVGASSLSPENPDKLQFSQELTDLKSKFQQTTNKYPKLELSAFFVDLDNGAYVNYNGTTPIAAASTIKIPILVAFFQDVDAGKISLDEELTLTSANNVSGSGEMQYQGINKKYSAIYTATEMIISSDNAATEMIIERLGGKDALNQRFSEWGLEHTVINNKLPDLEGTNTTSPKDLVMVLGKVNQGDLISPRSRDRLLDIMRRTKTRTLLPQGIEAGAMIAHKTGDIGSVLGDAGIIDMTTGKRYIGAVIVKRPHNDLAGRSMIQDISRQAYQHFKWYLPR